MDCVRRCVAFPVMMSRSESGLCVLFVVFVNALHTYTCFHALHIPLLRPALPFCLPFMDGAVLSAKSSPVHVFPLEDLARAISASVKGREVQQLPQCTAYPGLGRWTGSMVRSLSNVRQAVQVDIRGHRTNPKGTTEAAGCDR